MKPLLAAVSMALVVAAAFTDYGPFSWDGNDPRNQWTLRTGVIRFGTTGPYILSNSSHITVGLPTVEISSDGALWIYSDGAGVGSITVNGDERTAKLGILLGVSSGVGTAKVSFYRIDFTQGRMRPLLLNVPADYQELVAGMQGAHNLWVTWFTPYREGE